MRSGSVENGCSPSARAEQRSETQRRIAVARPWFERSETVDFFQLRQTADRRENVVLVGIRPVSRLPEERHRTGALQKRNDLAARVVAMERRVAHIAHARARQKDERRFHSAGKPDRNTIPRANAGLVQVLGDGINPMQSITERQPTVGVSKRETLGRRLGPSAQQHVERVSLPITALVEFPRARDVLQRQDGVHRTCKRFIDPDHWTFRFDPSRRRKRPEIRRFRTGSGAAVRAGAGVWNRFINRLYIDAPRG